jgi:hypothetical protein
MSTLSLHTVSVRLALVAALVVTAVGTRAAHGQAATPDAAWAIPVAISEVYPVPQPEQAATWVELVNFGEQAVPIGSWCLADKGGVRYIFPQAVPPVPPHGLVLVSFAAQASPADDDRSFAEDNVARLYARAPGATESFRGEINECALYASPEPQPQQIVDYVCWGEYRQTAHAVAARQAGLWTSSYGVSRAQLKPGEDESVVLSEGRTIGKVVFRKPVWVHDPETGEHAISPSDDWFIYIREEASPGRPNAYPSPMLFMGGVGRPNLQTQVESLTLICIPRYPKAFATAARWQDHLQVATDAGFANLVVDAVDTRGGPYRHTPVPPPGRYYWRARMEKGEEHSPWAPPQTFEIVPH